MEIKEPLMPAHIAVIASCRLFLEFDIFFKQFFLREGNAIHSLQGIIAGFTQPVGSTVFRQFNSLHITGGRQVRPHA